MQRQPNDLLKAARRRMSSPSGSGRPLSRQELADAVNAWLWANTGRVFTVSARSVGQWERGDYRWPMETTRRALRVVLGVDRDADLGFYIVRDMPTAPAPLEVPQAAEEPKGEAKPVEVSGPGGPVPVTLTVTIGSTVAVHVEIGDGRQAESAPGVTAGSARIYSFAQAVERRARRQG